MMRDHITLQDLLFEANQLAGVSNCFVPDLEKTRLELRRGREVGSIGGGRAAAYVDGIVGRFDNLLDLGVVEGQLVEAEWKLHCLSLTGVESDASKALEIAYRLLCAGPSDIDIALNNLGGTALACIGDCGGCDDGLALLIAHQRG
jgi:hypothetical protein